MRCRFAPIFVALALPVVGSAHAQQLQQPPPAGAPKVEAPPSAGMNLARQLNEAFINVFEHVAPAVVVVDVSKKGGTDGENNPMDFFGDFFFRGQPNDGGSGDDNGNGGGGGNRPQRRPRQSQSEGSGFIIQADGYILTNNHVVSGSDTVRVRLKDGRNFAAKIVGSDEKTDIAVLKIDGQGFPTVELADSDAVRVGQLCFAIGVPFKQDYTFTQGVVSAKNRNNLNVAQYEDYIQTDASINPGNSGGPLLDLDGHVIGMNTLINGLNRGLGFAIPSNMLKEIGNSLIKTGRIVRPYIGVRIETLSDDAVIGGGNSTANNNANGRLDPSMVGGGVKKGVVVRTIEPDTPAYKSDLKPADVITEVDGQPVNSDRELQKRILSKKVGDTVQLTVVRKGKTIKVPVVTGELPSDVAGAAGSRRNALPQPDEPGTGKDNSSRPGTNNFFGLQVQKMTKELAESMGVETDTGVIVTNVADDSPAARAGIRVKDVITEIGDKPVTDVESLKEALKGADPKRGIDCYVTRGGSKTFVVIKGS